MRGGMVILFIVGATLIVKGVLEPGNDWAQAAIGGVLVGVSTSFLWPRKRGEK